MSLFYELTLLISCTDNKYGIILIYFMCILIVLYINIYNNIFRDYTGCNTNGMC